MSVRVVDWIITVIYMYGNSFIFLYRYILRYSSKQLLYFVRSLCEMGNGLILNAFV